MSKRLIKRLTAACVEIILLSKLHLNTMVILQDSRFKMTDNLYKYEEVMLFVYQIRQEKLDILIHSSI